MLIVEKLEKQISKSRKKLKSLITFVPLRDNYAHKLVYVFIDFSPAMYMDTYSLFQRCLFQRFISKVLNIYYIILHCNLFKTIFTSMS